jgi:hypothetical protein
LRAVADPVPHCIVRPGIEKFFVLVLDVSLKVVSPKLFPFTLWTPIFSFIDIASLPLRKHLIIEVFGVIMALVILLK